MKTDAGKSPTSDSQDAPDRTTQNEGLSAAPPSYGIGTIDRVTQQENPTDLPDNLKAGIEQLSGLSMDDVRVYYNSEKPGQLGALAYTRGTEIHIGPGQNKHLPHEAWHVVQQKKGLVRINLKCNGVPINLDKSLENEADMVRGILACDGNYKLANNYARRLPSNNTKLSPHHSPLQLVKPKGSDGTAPHIYYGPFFHAEQEHKINKEAIHPPLIIEILEPSKTAIASASDKINKLSETGRPSIAPVAFVFGINHKLADKTTDVTTIKSDVITDAQKMTGEQCEKISNQLEKTGIYGGCIPILWVPTNLSTGGYVFPFFECRSILTSHKGLEHLHQQFRKFGIGEPVVRSMDADVSDDALLNSPAIPNKAEAPLAGHAESKPIDMRGVRLSNLLTQLSLRQGEFVTGGYEWNTDDITQWLASHQSTDKKAPKKPIGLAMNNSPSSTHTNESSLGNYLRSIIETVNLYEHEVRTLLNLKFRGDPRAIYWPEPNLYMTLENRQSGAEKLTKAVKPADQQVAQQGESTHYIKRESEKKTRGLYEKRFTTRKPLKSYFDDFLSFFSEKHIRKEPPEIMEIKNQILGIRQTHLNMETVLDVWKWQNMEDIDKSKSIAEEIVQEHLIKCAKDIQKLFVPQ